MDNHRQNYNDLNKQSNLTPMIILFFIVLCGLSYLFYEFINFLAK